jgi:hypothetical protein
MLHYVLRSPDRSPLFIDAAEAVQLWRLVLARVPGPVALYLMADHLHLQHRREVGDGLTSAMRAYAHFRNARRGQSGPVWERRSAAHRLVDRQKQRRSERYILLNGCRASLEADPLAWTLSTHRDALGLALPLARPRAPQPVRYHAWVSSDPTACVTGTPYPLASGNAPELEPLRGAVSELTRTPLEELRQRGPARTLLVQAARTLTSARVSDICDVAGVSRRVVQRTSGGPRREIEALASMAGDPRFGGLDDAVVRARVGMGRWRA